MTVLRVFVQTLNIFKIFVLVGRSFPCSSLGTGLQQKLCFESEKWNWAGKRSKSFWYRHVPMLELGNERIIRRNVMLSIKTSSHISSMRNIKSYRSGHASTGVSMSHEDRGMIFREEERLLQRNNRRRWLIFQWNTFPSRRFIQVNPP